jgi:hypothetical protein
VVQTPTGTLEEFADNSHKAIKWLFYSGEANKLSPLLLWSLVSFKMQL